jgi:hypothetical protein
MTATVGIDVGSLTISLAGPELALVTIATRPEQGSLTIPFASPVLALIMVAVREIEGSDTVLAIAFHASRLFSVGG